MVYHTGTCVWKPPRESGRMVLVSPSVARESQAKGGLMLATTRHRLQHNSLFHFHPLHSVFSLLAVLLLFGMLIWFLAIPAR